AGFRRCRGFDFGIALGAWRAADLHLVPLAAEFRPFAVRVAADGAAPVTGRTVRLARLFDAGAAVVLALALRVFQFLDLGECQVGGLAALHGVINLLRELAAGVTDLPLAALQGIREFRAGVA